jgi:hypothetical protein
MDHSKMTDAEFDAYVRGLTDEDLEKLHTSLIPVATVQDMKKVGAPPKVDNTMGMSGPELFAAGLAQRALGIPRGLQELAIGVTGSPEEIAKYNEEKRERDRIDSQLASNWQANLGGLGWDVGTAALLPAKIGPQAIAAGAGAFSRPVTGDIQGPEVLGRLTNAGVSGGTTLAVGQALKGAGKAIGAARGQYTEDGARAMAENEAARRLGVRRQVGDLDPTSQLAAFERSLPGYPAAVADQASSFSKAAQEVKDIPSKTGRSFEPRLLEGEKLRGAIIEGGDNLVDEGRKLWQSLDNYVVQNGLPPVRAANTESHVSKILSQYTPVTKKGPQVQKNPVIQRIDEYDPDAAQALIQSANPKSTLAFDDIHKLQSAVGKAMQRAEKDAAASGASMEDRKVRSELRALYGNLTKDVDSWATKDKNAQNLLSDAKTFWRDRVVPGAMNNKVYQKASVGIYGSNPRAYSDPAQFYGDVNRFGQNMRDLYPYMPQEGRDLYTTLSTMPDVSKMLTSRNPLPPPPALGPLAAAAGMIAGSPFQLARGVLSHIPGTRQVMSSEPAKRFYFGRNVFSDDGTIPSGPLGRMAWAASQVPQQKLEEGSKKSLGLKQLP